MGKKQFTRINEQIRVSPVRLINEKGEQLGIIDTDKARAMAREQELDLVEIAPNARPPVCKIMDFGKFKYEQRKLEQKARKNQKKSEVKGIRLSLRISENDFNIKAKKAKEFLKEGHKIRVEVMLRGRENIHRDLAIEMIKKFIDKIPIKVNIEQKPKKERLGLGIIISAQQ